MAAAAYFGERQRPFRLIGYHAGCDILCALNNCKNIRYGFRWCHRRSARRSLRLFQTTVTELSAMARAARIGCSDLKIMGKKVAE